MDCSTVFVNSVPYFQASKVTSSLFESSLSTMNAKRKPSCTKVSENRGCIKATCSTTHEMSIHSAEKSPFFNSLLFYFSTGDIPSWLSGSLLRVGPGKYEWGDTKYNHWFDGESLIHKFEIKDGGKVQYSNRFLRSESYTKAEKRGCISMNSFATVAPPDPCKNIFARFFSYFAPPESFTDNCNVNVVNIKGQPVALTEVPTMWRFDPEDLSSVERLNAGEKLGGKYSSWYRPVYDT